MVMFWNIIRSILMPLSRVVEYVIAAITAPGVVSPLRTCPAPVQSIITTARYISALVAGFMKANSTSVRSWVLIWASLAFPNRIFSQASWTQALMIRIPDTSSCRIAFT